MKALPSLLALLVTLPALHAQTPAAPGSAPALKDLDGYFPFPVPSTREAWEKRSAEVRQRMLVSQGLFPEPTRTPLNAVVHGRIDGDGYSVEKAYFEAMPGFFVTGNIYRPRGKSGPFPAVLCAHGHWSDARFAIRGDAEMKKELASGSEKLPGAGRSIFQSIGVGLARMGCVAFVYDMIGNSDSQQLSADLAHGFKKQRPEAESPEGWGFFSAQAELRLQSIMGLQTWSSIRAIDFVSSLPDVDPKRIGMTGASGGGTQTFIAAAIDPRITVAAPCVMVSTAMQGGCTCENNSLLRIGTGNIEIAALFAPKPLGMTTADDWTREMPTKGFPELQKLYALVGAPENVTLWHQPQFAHNYNAPTREHIYAWFNRHFGLGHAEPIVEKEFPLLSREQLSVYDNEHPRPEESGLALEKRLLRWWDEDSSRQIAQRPEVAKQGWHMILDQPADAPASPDAPSVELQNGVPVINVPPLSADRQPVVKNPREFLGYTLGYNPPIFARQVHTVLGAIQEQAKKGAVVLVGGPAAAAAAALSVPSIRGLALSAGSEQAFEKITDWRDPLLVPGALKYGGVARLLQIIAPKPTATFQNDTERAAAVEKLAK